MHSSSPSPAEMPKGRWYTMTSVRFEGDAHFFSRDSGFLCRSLQRYGYESHVIMPGPAFDTPGGEHPDILRATDEELRSAAWWRSLKLDGVIFMGWMMPCDTAISEAIVASGTRLVLHYDGGHHGYPFREIGATWRYLHSVQRDLPGSCLKKKLTAIWRMIRGVLTIIPYNPWQRMAAMYNGKLITCLNPVAAENLDHLCQFLAKGNHGLHIAKIAFPIQNVYGE